MQPAPKYTSSPAEKPALSQEPSLCDSLDKGSRRQSRRHYSHIGML